MAEIKSASAIAEKWARVTPQRAEDYREGIQSPKKDWERETLRASDAYEAGVNESIAQGRFSRGVSQAGTEKWQRKAREVGTTRWPAGVQAARSDYEQGFSPFREVIEATDLPPRGPKGSPQNIQRVVVIADRLHAAKVGG